MTREEREKIIRRLMAATRNDEALVTKQEQQVLEATLASEAKLLEACKAAVRAYDSHQLYDKFPKPLLEAAIADADPPEVPAEAKSAVKGGD